ncbi:MAG: sugar ABC transporter ATP-binding protein [Sedimentisphaerales bacterium]
MSTDLPLLQMQGIEKSFPGVKALDKVDLDVYPCEVAALIGENGAGKSTLMNILGGVLQPDAGVIKIDGKTTIIHNVSEAIKLGIGFIHQDLNILDNLTIAGNVFLGREPLRFGPLKLIDNRRLRTQTEPYLKRLGLDLSPDTPLSELPIAHQQMVEIAKALSLNARILIMDEPTSSLTLAETKRLFEVIRQLRNDGVSVIYISHRLAEVKECADRVIGLRDGVNAGSLSREQITHDNMVNLMIGRQLEDFYISPATHAEPGYFRVNNLTTAAYPDCQISFEAARGEILGFAGLVGAGRSEMARAIFGADHPIGGSVHLAGERLQIRSAKDAIENGISLMPEDRRKSGLIVEMTVRENITLPNLASFAFAGLIKRNQEKEAALAQCKQLKIKTPSSETVAGNLSGGNQQKVVLAKWLALAPRVIIFDEPTRGIDVGAKSEIYHLMRNLADNGVVVIIISSDMEEILGVSDRIAVMHEGKITGLLERSEFDEETVMRLAVGHTIERQSQ